MKPVRLGLPCSAKKPTGRGALPKDVTEQRAVDSLGRPRTEHPACGASSDDAVGRRHI